VFKTQTHCNTKWPATQPQCPSLSASTCCLMLALPVTCCLMLALLVA